MYDGWMDGWVDGGRKEIGGSDGWVGEGRKGGREEKEKGAEGEEGEGRKEGRKDGWMDGWMARSMYGATDGWMDRWMDGEITESGRHNKTHHNITLSTINIAKFPSMTLLLISSLLKRL